MMTALGETASTWDGVGWTDSWMAAPSAAGAVPAVRVVSRLTAGLRPVEYVEPAE